MNLITKAFKFRCYPTPAQQRQIEADFNVARWAYNESLDLRSFCYRNLNRSVSLNDCSKAITELKRDPDWAWLKEANSSVITQALRDLDTAFKNFFAGRAKYPTFHSKRGPQSCRYPLDQRQIKRTFNAGIGLLKLPKIGALKLSWSQPVPSIPKMATVSRDAVGDYYISIACEIEIEPIPKGKGSVGVDVGVKDVLVTSDGFKSGAPKFIRQYERQLKRAQQTLSRRMKGSGRWHQARIRVAKIQRKIARCRLDFTHKLTTWLVKTYDVIAVEDLNVAGMVRNRKLAKAITDSGLGELLRQIEYKSAWYGREVIQCGRFDPSSKACSGCGSINAGLTLGDRLWTCLDCGTAHDRDVNAANNVLMFALAAGRAVTGREDLQTAAVG